MIQREKKTGRIELRTLPSLKSRAEAVAARKNQTLSDYTHDLLEAAVTREERRAAHPPPGRLVEAP